MRNIWVVVLFSAIALVGSLVGQETQTKPIVTQEQKDKITGYIEMDKGYAARLSLMQRDIQDLEANRNTFLKAFKAYLDTLCISKDPKDTKKYAVDSQTYDCTEVVKGSEKSEKSETKK